MAQCSSGKINHDHVSHNLHIEINKLAINLPLVVSLLFIGTVNQLIACCRIRSFTNFKNMLEKI